MFTHTLQPYIHKIYKHTYIHTYIYIYTYIHIHINIYIHAQKHKIYTYMRKNILCKHTCAHYLRTDIQTYIPNLHTCILCIHKFGTCIHSHTLGLATMNQLNNTQFERWNLNTLGTESRAVGLNTFNYEFSQSEHLILSCRVQFFFGTFQRSRSSLEWGECGQEVLTMISTP